jgi:hypothetical protein
MSDIHSISLDSSQVLFTIEFILPISTSEVLNSDLSVVDDITTTFDFAEVDSFHLTQIKILHLP